MTFKLWLKDTEERVIATVIQSLIVFIAASGPLNASVWKSAVAAVIPGVINVLKQALTTWTPQPQSWFGDTSLRAIWTFAITFLGAYSANGLDLFNASLAKMAAMGGFTAVLAVIKAAIAKRVPNTITPASLATPSTPPATPPGEKVE